MLKVVVTLLVIAAAALLPVLAWGSYDVTGSSPASTFHTGVRVPAECAGMTFDQVITLTGGNDTTVVPGSTRDLIFGLGGRDEIDGGNGPDCIVGGEGDDRLKGSNGDDVILGGPRNDEIEGGHGDDHLYGGDGDDAIDGGPGRDECEGGSGSDTISGCEHDSRPAAPWGLRAACDHSRRMVELSWGQVEGVVYYNIYRGSAQGGPYEGIGSSRAAAFQDQDVAEGLAYYYIVTAVDGFQVQSEDSDEAGVLTVLSTPEPSLALIVTPSPSPEATATLAPDALPTPIATPEQEPIVSPEPSPSPDS